MVYAPECPPVLAQEFVNTSYARIIRAGNWSAVRGEGEFVIPATYSTGTANVTQSSTGVTGTGTTWTSAMIGRQFFTVGTGPFYTITDVPTSTSLTLDRVYGEATANLQVYDILLVLITLPTDFLKFQSVMDRANNWRLHTGFRQEQLDTWDSKRSVNGTPTILATAPYTSAGVPRAEIWPRVTSGKTYSYRYERKPVDLSAATDTTIYPISSDVIRLGSLVELAKWPGLAGAPNPYFNLDLHKINEMEFQVEVQRLLLDDQKILQTAVTYEGWESVPYAPIDANYIQTHDVL